MLRTVWRQLLMFAHNALVYVAALAIFFAELDHPYATQSAAGACRADLICNPGLSPEWLLGLLGLALVLLNMTWLTLFFGIVSTRFRDFPQLINAIVRLLFYLTPIVWPIDQLLSPGGSRHALRAFVEPIIQLNPVYHLIQVVRGPFIGQLFSPWSFVVCAGMAILGWTVTLLLMRVYRARVSYWV